MTDSAPAQATPFTFEGMIIERIIIHRIFSKDRYNTIVPPKTSSGLISLNQEAKDALQMRITSALGSKSHGIETSIMETGDTSFFKIAATMIHSDDNYFIEASQKHADELTKAQSSTNAPDGLLTLISGRIGSNAFPFIAAIKAEPQDGFKANEQDGRLDMEYISELLLTESQRFYKIGLLVETINSSPNENGYQPINYRTFLFDHLVTATETKNAAIYFYKTFLGMDIQASSRRQTEDFYKFTMEFINASPVTGDVKFEQLEALRSELRSQETIISVSEFGAKHLGEEQCKRYQSFMQMKKFPQNSIVKDTKYIRDKLKKRRKYVFGNDVWILTPPGDTQNFISIEEADEAGITIVKIKGKFEGQK